MIKMRQLFFLVFLFFEGTRVRTKGEFTKIRLRPVIVYVSETLVIDCISSNPDNKITLHKDMKDITNDERVQYDPEEGFLIKDVRVEDEGLYMCKDMSGGWPLRKVVRVQQNTRKTLKPPRIDKGKNQHFLKGESFKLECLVSDPNNIIFIWTNPNENKIPIPVQKSTKQVLRNNTLHWSSILEISNASTADTGNYTCTIFDAEASLRSSASVNIVVEETKAPYVSIDAYKTINLNEGDDLGWSAKVRLYPSRDPDIIYTRYTEMEGNQTLRRNDRISYEFKANEAWLNITNLTRKDFGSYTLTVTTYDGSAKNSSSLEVLVASAPYVELRVVPEIVTRGNTVNVTCSVQGYPIPDVSFVFESCSNTSKSSCESPFSLQDKIGVQAVRDNIVLRSFTFSPPTSGLLSCTANNTIKGQKETKFIIVSSNISNCAKGNYMNILLLLCLLIYQ